MATIVQLTNGLMLWSADNYLAKVDSPSNGLDFEPRSTAILAPSGNRGELAIVKMSEDIGKPKEVFFPIFSILSIRDSTDEELNTKCRAALSGLVLAK